MYKDKKCDQCGIMFRPKNMQQMRCSPHCSHLAKLEKQRSRAKDPIFRAQRNARRRKAYAENRHGVRDKVLAQQREWRERVREQMSESDRLTDQIAADLNTEAANDGVPLDADEIAQAVRRVVQELRAQKRRL